MEWFSRFCSYFPRKQNAFKIKICHCSLSDSAVSSSEGTIFFVRTLFNAPRGFTTFSVMITVSSQPPKGQPVSRIHFPVVSRLFVKLVILSSPSLSLKKKSFIRFKQDHVQQVTHLSKTSIFIFHKKTFQHKN